MKKNILIYLSLVIVFIIWNIVPLKILDYISPLSKSELQICNKTDKNILHVQVWNWLRFWEIWGNSCSYFLKLDVIQNYYEIKVITLENNTKVQYENLWIFEKKSLKTLNSGKYSLNITNLEQNNFSLINYYRWAEYSIEKND